MYLWTHPGGINLTPALFTWADGFDDSYRKLCLFSQCPSQTSGCFAISFAGRVLLVPFSWISFLRAPSPWTSPNSCLLFQWVLIFQAPRPCSRPGISLWLQHQLQEFSPPIPAVSALEIFPSLFLSISAIHLTFKNVGGFLFLFFPLYYPVFLCNLSRSEVCINSAYPTAVHLCTPQPRRATN